jgi:hypothetical protein
VADKGLVVGAGQDGILLRELWASYSRASALFFRLYHPTILSIVIVRLFNFLSVGLPGFLPVGVPCFSPLGDSPAPSPYVFYVPGECSQGKARKDGKGLRATLGHLRTCRWMHNLFSSDCNRHITLTQLTGYFVGLGWTCDSPCTQQKPLL